MATRAPSRSSARAMIGRGGRPWLSQKQSLDEFNYFGRYLPMPSILASLAGQAKKALNDGTGQAIVPQFVIPHLRLLALAGAELAPQCGNEARESEPSLHHAASR